MSVHFLKHQHGVWDCCSRSVGEHPAVSSSRAATASSEAGFLASKVVDYEYAGIGESRQRQLLLVASL